MGSYPIKSRQILINSNNFLLMANPKVTDLAFIRLRSPDLDLAEKFLTDFGMVRAERTPTTLYMRGTSEAPYLHVTELGEPKVIGFAFYIGPEAQLQAFAAQHGNLPIEDLEGPGGGKRVRLTDPLGFQIELVAGLAPTTPLPVLPRALNLGNSTVQRAGKLQRIARQPSQVKRIGHMVLTTPDHENTIIWYRNTLGLVSSDDVWAGRPDHLIASFIRVNKGQDYVDHHVFMVTRGERSGMNHISFEVQDFDDVMIGHEYLHAAGNYKPYWGVGRHFLGSQIFDYWSDPWGRAHEHWTDTDLLNDSHEPASLPVQSGFSSQWGIEAPEEFIQLASR